MRKESIKTFLSGFSTRGIGGAGDENEMCENVSVQRPPQCKAVGVLSRLVIGNKPHSLLFYGEILKYSLFIIFLSKKRLV